VLDLGIRSKVRLWSDSLHGLVLGLG
jgi:hypothetical protein